MARHTMKPVASCTKAMPTIAGATSSRMNAMPRRGPILSHTTPIRKRQMMLEVTEAMLPDWICGLVKPSVLELVRTGASGAGAKVEKNVEKKPNHAAWNACMCGFLTLKRLIVLALCSVST